MAHVKHLKPKKLTHYSEVMLSPVDFVVVVVVVACLFFFLEKNFVTDIPLFIFTSRINPNRKMGMTYVLVAYKGIMTFFSYICPQSFFTFGKNVLKTK